MLYIFPHHPYSHGAKELAKALNIKRLRETSKLKLTKHDVVINWGNASELPNNFRMAQVINTPKDIQLVSNKRLFFIAMADVKYNEKPICPKFWETAKEVTKFPVLCRTILSGSGGDGIVISNSAEELVPAKLYVKYVPKDAEYRVHICNKTVIDVQQKAKRSDVSNPNWKIRNLEGGFIYKRNDITPPECVRGVALTCMASMNLDFGAVDVIYNKKNNRAYVLEVNSAPGLEGTTVENYARVFKTFLKRR